MKTMREATFYSLAALLEGPAHGYAILERVKKLSGGHVSLATGTLYAVLDRLEDEGLIQRTATEIVRGRARQYFEITEEGFGAVQAQAQRMALGAEAVRRASTSGPVRSGTRKRSTGRLAPETLAFV
jgi:DNA-binding PadR family transcriptional regulator